VGYIARNAVCNRCRTQPETPVVCLLCGQLVCYDAACCAEPGASISNDEVFTHGARCSRGMGFSTGVFLMINSGLVVVLLGDSRHCVWGALYLDAHEEEDRNLARGKPLFLNLDRLRALEEVQRTQSWLLQTKVLDHIRLYLGLPS
jgi:E3 ubiquitin-protein ligase UBR3